MVILTLNIVHKYSPQTQQTAFETNRQRPGRVTLGKHRMVKSLHAFNIYLFNFGQELNYNNFTCLGDGCLNQFWGSP